MRIASLFAVCFHLSSNFKHFTSFQFKSDFHILNNLIKVESWKQQTVLRLFGMMKSLNFKINSKLLSSLKSKRPSIRLEANSGMYMNHTFSYKLDAKKLKNAPNLPSMVLQFPQDQEESKLVWLPTPLLSIDLRPKCIKRLTSTVCNLLSSTERESTIVHGINLE